MDKYSLYVWREVHRHLSKAFEISNLKHQIYFKLIKKLLIDCLSNRSLSPITWGWIFISHIGLNLYLMTVLYFINVLELGHQ